MRLFFTLITSFGVLVAALTAQAADYREARIPSGKNPLTLEYGLHPILRSSNVSRKAPVADPSRVLSTQQERQLLTASIGWERQLQRSSEYALGGLNERIRESEENRRRSSELLSMMRSYQARQLRESLDAADRQGRVSRPLILTGTLVATYLGNPFQQSIGGGAEVRGYANVPDRSGALGVFAQSLGEWGLQYDRQNQLKIHSKQAVSELGLSTEINYVTRDRSMDAQVTRPITSLLSTSIGARVPTDSDSSLASVQGVWRVDFGLSF